MSVREKSRGDRISFSAAGVILGESVNIAAGVVGPSVRKEKNSRNDAARRII